MHFKTLTFFISATIYSLQGCSPKPDDQSPLWSEEERVLLVKGLEDTREAVIASTSSLTDDQWNAKNDPESWSMAEVVEHLILQDQAYYREIKVVAALPPTMEYVEQVKGNDARFMEYANDPNKSKADWDVTPTGRFCSRADALETFLRVRNEIIQLITRSKADFRQVFTFRNIPQKVVDRNPEFYRVRQVRDLHQLVLNAIAHTERHLGQMDRIKSGLTE